MSAKLSPVIHLKIEVDERTGSFHFKAITIKVSEIFNITGGMWASKAKLMKSKPTVHQYSDDLISCLTNKL